MSFGHQDGLVPALTFARKYAALGGRVATLPEIVELRLDKSAGHHNWYNQYTSLSAEYYGIGADGQLKIIVAHGVGPMSTIDGIKAAYKWEWGDSSHERRGGRITAQQFLDLEAGEYGEVKLIKPSALARSDGKTVRKFNIAPVNVLDFEDYLDSSEDVFYSRMTVKDALRNPLLRMRLGSNAYRYLMAYEKIVQGDESQRHAVINVSESPNCPYMLYRGEEQSDQPRTPERGMAFAHLLGVDRYYSFGPADSTVPKASTIVHDWGSRDVKFVSVPAGVTLQGFVAERPYPRSLIRGNWERFMQAVEADYTRPFMFELEHYLNATWFTLYLDKEYPRNVEFHVRSVEQVGEDKVIKTNETPSTWDLGLWAPIRANAFYVISSSREKVGCYVECEVTVRYYRADVDTTRRLPHAHVVARDYDLLMGDLS
jgi:hypothetical protein